MLFAPRSGMLKQLLSELGYSSIRSLYPRLSAPSWASRRWVAASTFASISLALPFPRLRVTFPSLLRSSPTASESSEPDAPLPQRPSPSSHPSEPPPGSSSSPSQRPLKPTPLEAMLNHPALFSPVRAPRHPIVLCHGLYGFDVRGPSAYPRLQIHYWSNVLEILRKKVGAEVLVTGVPSTGSVESRAKKMHEYLTKNMPGRELNFLAHSMGGLDCRHLISRIRPREYIPRSLTTVATPHRGSPFMDWCTANIGIGALREALDSSQLSPELSFIPYSLKSPLLSRPIPTSSSSSTSSSEKQAGLKLLSSLPTSLTTILLSMLDSPAYSNLTRHFCNNVFNPSTPDDPTVRYFSIAARTSKMSIFHPLWLPKLILDEVQAAEREKILRSTGFSRGDGTGRADGDGARDWGNDGLVSVESAKWGEFLGVLEGVDHWESRGTGGLAKEMWEADGQKGLGGWSEFLGWKSKESEKEAAANAQSGGDQVIKMGPGKVETTAPKSLHSLPNDSSSSSSYPSPSSPPPAPPHNTDHNRLASTMHWIADHVPNPIPSSVSIPISLPIPIPGWFSSTSSSASPSNIQEETEKARKQEKEKEKFDLERFYVAIARKMYDEGL